MQIKVEIILLGDKNATSLCSKTISTLKGRVSQSILQKESAHDINNIFFFRLFISSYWIWTNKHWFHCPSWNSDGYFGHDICSWRRPIQEKTKKKEIRNFWQKTGIHWKLQYKSTFEASLHQKCTKPTKKKEIYTSFMIFIFLCSFLVLT